jgi:hypothetical protein
MTVCAIMESKRRTWRNLGRPIMKCSSVNGRKVGKKRGKRKEWDAANERQLLINEGLRMSRGAIER